jgi:hypothetical protein
MATYGEESAGGKQSCGIKRRSPACHARFELCSVLGRPSAANLAAVGMKVLSWVHTPMNRSECIDPKIKTRGATPS